MTIDERLEALTQTVELMASMQKDNQRHTRAALDEAAAEIAKTAQLINQLARVVKTHEQRLDKIEHRQ